MLMRMPRKPGYGDQVGMRNETAGAASPGIKVERLGNLQLSHLKAAIGGRNYI
jgi:hypothetical protein